MNNIFFGKWHCLMKWRGGGGRASSMKFASKDRAIEVYRQSSIAIHIHESERESI